MSQITEEQVILCAERLDLSNKPTAAELQKVADELKVNYGWISDIWDRYRIGTKLTNKRAIREREQAKKKKEQEAAKKEKHKCIDCGAVILTPRAKLCLDCAYRRQLERDKKRLKVQ